MPSLNTNITATSSALFPAVTFSQANVNNVINGTFTQLSVSTTPTIMNNNLMGARGAYLYVNVPTTNPAGRVVKIVGTNPADSTPRPIASLNTGDTAFAIGLKALPNKLIFILFKIYLIINKNTIKYSKL